MDLILESVLRLANAGIPVFPLRIRGKEPLTRHGFLDATTNQDQIHNWWTKTPSANIGIPTGDRSGVAVLDVDPRHQGDQTLRSLLGKWNGGEPLASAGEVKTGGGGSHYYFACPAEQKSRVIGPGLELKANGAYVVVPPSIHPSGVPYSWGREYGFPTLPITVALPPWLRDFKVVPKTKSNGNRSPIAEGSRNATLASLAGTMRRRGMSNDGIEAALLKENAERCQPPLPDDEVRSIAESISRYEPETNPQEPPEDPPTIFPEIAWRGVFAEYRNAMHGTTEASDVVHFAALLTAAAANIGRGVRIFQGSWIYPNFYTLFVGPTGDRKTTAMRRITDCGLIHESVRKVSGVGSTEGLADALSRQSSEMKMRSQLFQVEEFSSLLARAAWKGSTLVEFFTEIYDCGAQYALEYRSSGKVILNRPTPSILAVSTEEWFWKRLRVEDIGGGLINRFLILSGTRKDPIPRPSPWDSVQVESIRERFFELVSLEDCGVLLSSEAQQAFDSFYCAWNMTERTGLHASAVVRIPTQVLKLAMIYAALESLGQPRIEISVEQIKAAIEVGNYSSRCAQVLLEAQSSHRPEGDVERGVLSWIQKHPGSKNRLVQQRTHKICGSCEVFNRAILNLLRAGLIEQDEQRYYATT